MQEVFYNFFIRFLHPVKVHTFFASVKSIHYPWIGRKPLRRIQLSEVVLVSWILVMVQTVWFMTAMSGIHSFILRQDISLFLPRQLLVMHGISLLSLVGITVFFPVFALVYNKFWLAIIGFYLNLYKIDRHKQHMEEVVNSSFVSNIFLLIPIFGPLMRNTAVFLFLFIGLSKNLGMTLPQSLLVLLTPLILFLLLLFFILLWITMVFWGA